jgi:UDP-perosamine 4-acetyltransferase
MRPLILIGAGGHGSVLLDVIRLTGRTLHGVSAQETPAGPAWAGLPFLGPNEALFDLDPDDFELVNGVGSVGSMRRRADLFSWFKARGFVFATLVHPAAVLGSRVILREGAQIMAGCVLQPDVMIGANSIVNTRASVDHTCRIGAHVHLAPGVTLSGDVVVEDEVHVGVGATVLQGRRLGAGCVVGAGAVVTRDVPPGVTVVGVPARPLPAKGTGHD